MIYVIKTIADVFFFLHARQSKAYTRVHLDAFLKDFPLKFTRPGVHITGTNGKGSTATFIASMLQQGYGRVGLFTSPPITQFHEMISISGKRIEDAFILSFFQTWADRFDDYELTYFEMVTLLAFAYFEANKVDIAVIEVGMGGKIDATNCFTPMLSIITNISLEHTDYLGPTLASIADHKAGIIKPHVPVLVGPLPQEAYDVVQTVATQNQSPILSLLPFSVQTNGTWNVGLYQGLSTQLKGDYQKLNLTLAVSAVHALQAHFPLTETAIRQGCLRAMIPGRLEKIMDSPVIYIDGAHNPGAMQALVQTWKTVFPHTELSVLFASFTDKALEATLEPLKTLTNDIHLTTFNHPRARIRKDYDGVDLPFVEDPFHFVSNWIQQLSPYRVLLITGSLAFVGVMRAYITTRS